MLWSRAGDVASEAIKCLEFREMKIPPSRRIFGPKDIFIGGLNKLIRTYSEVLGCPKSLFERLVDYKVCALPVFGYIGSLAPSPPSQKHAALHSDLQQDPTSLCQRKC